MLRFFRRVLMSVLWIGVSVAFGQTPRVLTGIDVLCERNFGILQGKRVGLITNPTGVDVYLRSTIDILASAPGVRLVALFGPEHGVRGDLPAGAPVTSSIDPRTHLPVFSLYGRTKKPSAEMMKGVDILVYDIQDIGVRSFTFIATMGLCMEAAAENGIPFVVLDRPNPLGGLRVEGTPVRKDFLSFVSPYPIPYIYGLTPGELAQYLNARGYLSGGIRCSLVVVPMKGWQRSLTFAETGLLWIPPSPHVPTSDAPMYVAALGVVGELGTVSEGVGFTLPFHLFGAEWIDQQRLAELLSTMRLPGVSVRPLSYRPFYGRDAGKDLQGVQIYIVDPEKVSLISTQFRVLEACHALFPGHNPFETDSTRLAMFDRVIGTDSVRTQFVKRFAYEDIEGLLTEGVNEFKLDSKQFWLYH